MMRAQARVSSMVIGLLMMGFVPNLEAGSPWQDEGESKSEIALDSKTLSEEVNKTLRKGVEWLIENQIKDGSWGSHHSPRPIEILADVPGSHRAFKVATSALCVIALEDCPLQTEASQAAANRGLDFLLKAYDVKRPNGLEFYNTWAYGYTLQAFGEWLTRHPEDKRRGAILAACEKLFQRVELYQTPEGGWGYLDFEAQTRKPAWTYMSFTTATVLLGLDRLRDAGVEVPPRIIEKAIKAILRSRTPEGNYLYGDYLRYGPRAEINQDKGAACRNPLCLYTLSQCEQEIENDAILKSLDDLLIRHTEFQRVALRRPIPHESWYSISGYFYLYGHAYAAYLLEGQNEETIQRFGPSLFESVMVCHQPDGSFWDYPLYSYHKPYGTAFALIALARLSNRWSPLTREGDALENVPPKDENRK